MIHLARDDIFHLYTRFRQPKASHCEWRMCSTCPTQKVCAALIEAWAPSKSDETVATTLYDACVHYREYTDKVCDTYSCPNCDHYICCSVLRGIAIEGVKLE